MELLRAITAHWYLLNLIDTFLRFSLLALWAKLSFLSIEVGICSHRAGSEHAYSENLGDSYFVETVVFLSFIAL